MKGKNAALEVFPFALTFIVCFKYTTQIANYN